MLSRKRFCRLAQAGIEPAVLGWRLFPNRTELRRIAAGNMANRRAVFACCQLELVRRRNRLATD